MKKFNTIIAVLLFGVVAFAGNVAQAQEEDAVGEVRAKIVEARAYHQELKDQVEAGEITKEEARAEWKVAIEALRTEKAERIDARMQKIQEKIEILKEENPERAEKLEERLEKAQEHRAERAVKNQELRDRVESGEITRSEAGEIRKEAFQEIREKHQERKIERQGKRDQRKEGRQTGDLE